MTDSLSSALARLFKTSKSATLWLDVLGRLPAGLWYADEGDPSMLSVLMTQHDQDSATEATTWADVYRFLLRPEHLTRPLSPEFVAPWMKQVLDQGDNAALAEALLDSCPTLMDQASPPWLAAALDNGWDGLAQRFLDEGLKVDISALPSQDHPYAHVRTLAALQSLADHGLEPWQTDSEGRTGAFLLREHLSNALSLPKKLRQPGLSWLTRRLAQDPSGSPAQSLNDVLTQHDARWTDLRDLLKIFGDDVWSVRFDHHQTLLHRLMSTHPDWINPLFRWLGTRPLPDDFFDADDRGLPPMFLGLAFSTPGRSLSWPEWYQDLSSHPLGAPLGARWIQITRKTHPLPADLIEPIAAITDTFHLTSLPLSHALLPFLHRRSHQELNTLATLQPFFRERFINDEAWHARADSLLSGPDPVGNLQRLRKFLHLFDFNMPPSTPCPPGTQPLLAWAERSSWLAGYFLLETFFHPDESTVKRNGEIGEHTSSSQRQRQHALHYARQAGPDVLGWLDQQTPRYPSPIRPDWFGALSWPILRTGLERDWLKAHAQSQTLASPSEIRTPPAVRL